MLNRWTLGAVSGGLAAYFFDPESGEDRRERLLGLWNDNQASARRAGRAASRAAAQAAPLARQIKDRRWDALFPQQPQRQEVPGVVKVFAAAVLGGTLAYFLDPDNGQRRRQRVVGFVQAKQERAIEAGRQAKADATLAVKQGVEDASSKLQAAQSRVTR